MVEDCITQQSLSWLSLEGAPLFVHRIRLWDEQGPERRCLVQQARGLSRPPGCANIVLIVVEVTEQQPSAPR